MKRIDHSTAADERFTEGNPATGTPATVVTADWLNGIQEELVHVITQAGITLDGEDLTQVYQAIAAMIADGVPDLSALIEHLTDTSDPHDTITTLDARTVYDTAYIGGGAMTPSLTAGAIPSVAEDTSSALSRSVMLFGSAADSSAGMAFPMPGNWDPATPVKARLFWTAPGGSAGDDIGFTLAARSLANDDALDQALGTAVILSDQLIAAGDLHISAASAALTVAGTPAAGQMLRLRLTRDVSSGASPLSEDVQVIGLQIQYATTGQQAAW
ncbi:MAG: hypothetical protein AB7E32_09340 [Desulfovibrio sp.]